MLFANPVFSQSSGALHLQSRNKNQSLHLHPPKTRIPGSAVLLLECDYHTQWWQQHLNATGTGLHCSH